MTTEDSAAVWSTVREQAAEAKTSPVLAPFLDHAIDAHATLPHAVAHMLSRKLASCDDGLPPALLESELATRLTEPTVCAALTSDLLCVVAADPAAPSLLTVLLHFKGFAALQAHRAAHSLWARAEQEEDAGARQLALLLQGRASELYGVDIRTPPAPLPTSRHPPLRGIAAEGTCGPVGQTRALRSARAYSSTMRPASSSASRPP